MNYPYVKIKQNKIKSVSAILTTTHMCKSHFSSLLFHVLLESLILTTQIKFAPFTLISYVLNHLYLVKWKKKKGKRKRKKKRVKYLLVCDAK